MYYDRLRAKAEAAAAKREKRREGLAVLDTLDVTQHIAPVYIPLHEDIQAGAYSTYNLPGGRGSCKSSFVSLEIVNGIMQDKTGESNAIVFRLLASTMRESVYSQIAWAIDMLDVNHLWKATVSPMCYTYIPTGAQIIFRGLDDPAKLKSIKPRRGTFRFVWFEEFSELPGPNFLRSVLQSVRRGGSGFVTFRSFNPPISMNNWANQHIQEPDPKAKTLHTDYTMIPADWLGDDFLYDAERLREVNPKAYEHEYLGIATGSGGAVFPNLEVRTITQEEADTLEYFYHGLDFGFAVDPCCFIRVAYDRKHDTVFLLDEIYERGLRNDQLAERIIERGHAYTGRLIGNGYDVGRERYIIVCDCAEPKSIADLKAAGLRAIACHKSPGCVEYRIKWLQHRKIIIDPARTPNAYREFVNYEYARDRDGNFMSVLLDKDNHSIDAVAYALNSLIYTKGASA